MPEDLLKKNFISNNFKGSHSETISDELLTRRHFV